MGIAAIIATIISLLPSAYQITLAEIAPGIQKALKNVAKQIQDKLSKNSALLDKFNLAYQQKNTGLMNSLFTGMGFGPRINAIRDAIEKNDTKQREVLDTYNKNQAKLNKIMNEVETASAQAGSSIHGAVNADEAVKQAQKDISNVNINQNINGGITT